MKRIVYAASVAAALALAPAAAFAQYVVYNPYAAPYTYTPYAYTPYWGGYSYAPSASAAWGYTPYYGSNSPWTGQASASSHPAYYGGSGGYSYHPGYGYGY